MDSRCVGATQLELSPRTVATVGSGRIAVAGERLGYGALIWVRFTIFFGYVKR
jgi:hypothetical protein